MNRPQPSLSHCFWFQEVRAAFVFLPKVACTSWKLFLAEALHGRLPCEVTYRNVHRVDLLGLPLVASMPEPEQRLFRQEAGRSIELMAMVREPRSRILSAYLDKFINRTDRQNFGTVIRPAIQAHHGLPPEQLPSFLQFLQWVASDTHPDCANDHWRPMAQLLGISASGDGGYRHLWRMDQLDLAVAELNRCLGSQVAFPSFQALGPRQASGSDQQLEQCFADPAVRSLFSDLYQNDLDLYAALASTASR
jgi:hypothetical protein